MIFSVRFLFMVFVVVVIVFGTIFDVVVPCNAFISTTTTSSTTFSRTITSNTFDFGQLSLQQHGQWRRRRRRRRRYGQQSLYFSKQQQQQLLLPCSYSAFSSSCLWASSSSSNNNDNNDSTTNDASSSSSSTKKAKTNNNNEEEAVLTDLDARVLQEMLKSDKLDLKKQENMKKLLERGIKKDGNDNDNNNTKKKGGKAGDAKDEEETNTFSSDVMKKLGNTKLWKGFQRNAQDWLESVSLFVSNRVERDAKLIASLGIFAFDRALKDVQRALPAAASATKVITKNAPTFLLGNTSSFQNITKPTTATTTVRSIREEMTTPLDELKSVQQDLLDIFMSAGTTSTTKSSKPTTFTTTSTTKKLGTSSSSTTTTTTTTTTITKNKSSLRSVVPSNSKFSQERFQKAYLRQKETTLKREKENIAQSSTRLASNLIDKAWEVKRDLEVEPNKPGYKTKALRASAAASANRLFAAGITRFLGGTAVEGKNQTTNFKLPETSSASADSSSSSSTVTKSQGQKKTVLDAEILVDIEFVPSDNFKKVKRDSEDAKGKVSTTTAAAAAAAASTAFFATPMTSQPMETQENKVVASAAATTTPLPQQQQQQQQQQQLKPKATLSRMEIQSMVQNELDRILQELDTFIQRPDESWLNPLLINEELESLDNLGLEEIVTALVKAQRKIFKLKSAISAAAAAANAALVLETKFATGDDDDDDDDENNNNNNDNNADIDSILFDSFTGILFESCYETKQAVEEIQNVAREETMSDTVPTYFKQRLLYGEYDEFTAKQEQQQDVEYYQTLPVLLKLDYLEQEWDLAVEDESLRQTSESLPSVAVSASTTTTTKTTTTTTTSPESPNISTTTETTTATTNVDAVVVPSIIDNDNDDYSTTTRTTTNAMTVDDDEDDEEENLPVDYFFATDAEPVSDDDENLERHEREDPVSFRVYNDTSSKSTSGSSTTTSSSSSRDSTKPIMEILDVIPEPVVVVQSTKTTTNTKTTTSTIDTEVSSSSSSTSIDSDGYTTPEIIVEDDDEMNMRVVAAEIVADDDYDFDNAVNKARTVEAVESNDDENENNEDDDMPLPLLLVLRTFDVLFLVIEKGIVFVPTMISLGQLVAARLEQAQQNGNGSEGWNILESAKRGEKRY